MSAANELSISTLSTEWKPNENPEFRVVISKEEYERVLALLSELSRIDWVLSRRAALDDKVGRVEKVEHACSTAARLDAEVNQLKHELYWAKKGQPISGGQS